MALTLKLYLCIAIISKEGHKRIIMGVVHNYSCILFRSLNSVHCAKGNSGARAASLSTNTQWDHKRPNVKGDRRALKDYLNPAYASL